MGTSSPKKIILIAMGCFNPPTPMHFRMFEIARDHFHHLNLGQIVGGVVSPVHDAYGKSGLEPATHRLNMVRIGLQSSTWIRLSDWETKQTGWSRTKQVLQHHQSVINSCLNPDTNSDVNGNLNGENCNGTETPSWLPADIKSLGEQIQLKFLCGADLLESFAKPGLWKEEDLDYILGNHGLVVISRSGCNPEQFIFDSDLLTRHRRNIHLVTNWVMNDVSSTVARRYLLRGLSAKYLLDDNILAYIHKHNLYFDSSSSITAHEYNDKNSSLVCNKNYLHNLKSTKSGLRIGYGMEIDETDLPSSSKKLRKRQKTKQARKLGRVQKKLKQAVKN